MIRKDDFVDGLKFTIGKDKKTVYELDFCKSTQKFWIFNDSILIGRIDKITQTSFHWSKLYFDTLITGIHKFLTLEKVD